MKTAAGLLCLLPFLQAALSSCVSPPGSPPSRARPILLPPGAAPPVRLAAREVRRYLYLRTGTLLPIRNHRGERPPALVLALDPSLPPDAYRLQTVGKGRKKQVRILGRNGTALLHGAYAFAEKLGVRFFLHGDVIPEKKIPFSLPDLDETGTPLFRLRGIQPFHDFPEGPDWWSLEDYRAVLYQLAKLRMNFIGFHCYPEGGVGPEPLVWIGLPSDIGPGPKVKFSYPSRWASTKSGSWGYAPARTSQFAAGAGMLFERDDFGSPLLRGLPFKPSGTKECNRVFERAGTMLGKAFRFARMLGIQVCLGTETPLTIPRALKKHLEEKGLDPSSPQTVRLLYEGIFRRLAQVSPADWYWLWTPESWTWGGTSKAQVDRTLRDIRLALEALEKAGRPCRFATCGWVLGPPSDRALFGKILPADATVSCINRQVGFSFVEPAFSLAGNREKWAIPWMEDDPALTIPQLWVGRVRRDAADALGRGCTGLFGIHWRTRPLGPNISALARAAWDQSGWNPAPGKPLPPPRRRNLDVHLGGTRADYAGNSIAGTDLDPVYRSCRYNLTAYKLRVPAGTYRVTLQFCEVHYGEPKKRVFGVEIQGKRVIDRLDVFARVGKNRALDFTFPGIAVKDGVLEIRFVKIVEFPFVAGIVLEGETREGKPYLRKINCGGKAWRDYEADLPAQGYEPAPFRPRDLPCRDFYRDWAKAQFGEEAAPALARLFESLDGGKGDYSRNPRTGTRLPRPATWIGGPGGILPNPAPWEKEKEKYAFVDHMASLRGKIRGAGNLARFDYWLDFFRYLRAVGKTGCARGALDRAMKEIGKEKNPTLRKRLARERALPLRVALARRWEELLTLALSWVSTRGGIGTIANLEEHVRRAGRARSFLSLYDKRLEKILGEPLPPSVRPARTYQGKPRLFVPTCPGLAEKGQRPALEAIFLDREPPREVLLHWRILGEGPFKALPLGHAGRGVYKVQLPPPGEEGLEFYLTATTASGVRLAWPPTAPGLCRTLLAFP